MENSFENYHNFYFRCTQVSFRKLIPRVSLEKIDYFLPLSCLLPCKKENIFPTQTLYIHKYYMMGYYNAKNPWSVQWCPISRLGLDWLVVHQLQHTNIWFNSASHFRSIASCTCLLVNQTCTIFYFVFKRNNDGPFPLCVWLSWKKNSPKYPKWKVAVNPLWNRS